MTNPLCWLFGYDTPNPDVIGRVRLTHDEIDAEAQERHRKKLRRARAYIRLRKLSVRPLYNTKGESNA